MEDSSEFSRPNHFYGLLATHRSEGGDLRKSGAYFVCKGREDVMRTIMRSEGRHDPSRNSLQRWANEGGAEKGVHRKSPEVASVKKKRRAKAAQKK
jgi:hypothetical protein